MRAPERHRPLRRKVAPAPAGATTGWSGSRARQGGLAALALALLLGAARLVQERQAVDQESLAPSRPIAVATLSGTTVAAPAPAGRAGTLSEAERALAAAINAARNEAGLPMLTMDSRLSAAAAGHSADLLDHDACSHEGSDGSTLESRLNAAGVKASAYAETVACGSGSADAAVRQWLDSKVHRPILLGKAYRRLGVGVAVSADGGDSRWTADLGQP